MSTELQKALAYVNRVSSRLSAEIALKADAGTSSESVDLSNYYTKEEVNILIPTVPDSVVDGGNSSSVFTNTLTVDGGSI